MKFYSPVEELKPNSYLLIKPDVNKKFSFLRIASSSYYTVKDKNTGKVLDFGPERTAKGYARSRQIAVETNDIEITSIYYGINTFEFDREDSFYFAIEFLDPNLNVIGDTSNLEFFINKYYNQISCKYSYQRAFVERFDTSFLDVKKIEFRFGKQLTLLEESLPTCLYNENYDFKLIKEGDFEGFPKIGSVRTYLSYESLKKYNKWDINKEFVEEVKTGYKFKQYEIETNSTGLIRVKINAHKPSKIFVVFDEFLPDGEWNYARDNCADIIEYKIDRAGTFEFLSSVPYDFKHFMVLIKGDAEVIPSIVLIQNDLVKEPESTGDEKLDLIIKAASNTFRQNAFDIFTDCPSRERAGWLCDAYFTGKAESFYTGNHRIERHFLENYILSSNTKIPEKMLSMCYPSNNIDDNLFIPNWAMWFVIELERYFNETNDNELINKAKDRVYGLLDYFKKFENHFGLLTNLESWIFIEWSKVNDDEYVKDVNFPTNMLYYGFLKAIIHLYKDDSLVKKAEDLKDTINKYSFNGTYYIDAVVVKDHKLAFKDLDLTQTCQYYALFFHITENDELSKLMLNPDPILAECAPFIGKFLRLSYLFDLKEFDLIKREYTDYFYDMAKKTNTLWEKNHPNGSCNHGFASVLGYYLSNLK